MCGLSLIELLISLFLVSLISAMIIHAYILNKHQYLLVENTLERNFDVQWVRDLLADSVRRAGFTPCLNIEQLEVVDRRIVPKLLGAEAITIKHDSLQVNRMNEYFAELIAISHPQQILVSRDAVFQEHDSILIVDCEHAEVHQISQVEKTPQGSLLTLDTSLFFSYPSETYVGQWIEEFWFIKNSRKGMPALFYKQSHSEELTPLIHSLISDKRVITGKQVVSIALGLDHEQHQQLTIAVRS